MSEEIYVRIVYDQMGHIPGLHVSKMKAFMYTTIDQVHYYYDKSSCLLLEIVKIPNDAKVDKLKIEQKGEIYLSDKIIVCQKYHLYDIKTAITLNLKITPQYIKNMYNLYTTDVWDELKNSGLKFEYDEFVLNMASRWGHIHILKWFKNSGLPLKYSKEAIDMASKFAQLDVLEWWKNSGLPLKYTVNSLLFGFGHIDKNQQNDVITWWKHSGLRPTW
uniref:Ankyrin repeat protein n=1 Tax=viral metagenome TaxID=1070528 RepID=A0A6C0E628_9ZZZZ